MKKDILVSRKNLKCLKKEYYITDLKSKITKYIQNCIPCILSNRKHGKQEVILHLISKGETPLDTNHIDYLGSLASTKKDYNYFSSGYIKPKQLEQVRLFRNWNVNNTSLVIQDEQLLTEEQHSLLMTLKNIAKRKKRPKEKSGKAGNIKIREENRKTFNKKRKKTFVYKEGDLVVIQKTQFATKSKLYPKLNQMTGIMLRNLLILNDPTKQAAVLT
ncbi:hypothetical protein LAZ67_X002406 [Cordylochernes scorpioides]|uniref:HNH endonuclease n=1 Tax=Cordylochernes scorpioides TaxID=51811 RepID=A0ABY6LTC5_9ARAC|nr:hypothetical protein LAZ67_X002406 [Cordylochernes scorpioides]